SPLLPHLPEKFDNLYIAPDGPLCFVSFAALPGRKFGTYAIEDFPISYVNSGRLLYQHLNSSRPSRGEGLLACGGIEYQRTERTPETRWGPVTQQDGDLPLHRNWKNLKAAEMEIDRALELHPQKGRGVRELKLSGRHANSDRLLAALSGRWKT